MSVLVTGAAGFIGFHTALALLRRGERVIGLDNLSDYYDVGLKQARLDLLAAEPGFVFARIDLTDRAAMAALFEAENDIEGIVHLAAQPGVRYSLENPFAYVDANVTGHLVVLEEARRCERLRHLVYASSSSVYGESPAAPFSTADRADRPVSLYAATKRMDELMSHTYAHLYDLPATGLRFFTVYGPWGRPDMAVYGFGKAILFDEPIRVFGKGELSRDFSFIDDIVAGVLAALDRPPKSGNGPPHRVYNLGNNHPETVSRLLAILEQAIGKKARVIHEPIQPGDVPATFADIEDSRRELGFEPATRLEEGVARTVDWMRAYHGR
ncbi:MAG: NAD-dependent epimerase/dehydratase family protein [Inquilinus sp.]|nr:NAD-dependent epimerase/dehydratase family protein [Inquilinus sp.]